MPKREGIHDTVTQAMSDGWVDGGSFLSSILAGLFLGLLLDRWLGTGAAFTVTGIILGSVSGFYQMWHHATKGTEDE